jgi:hypothetical protein
MSTGLKANLDGSAAIQVGGSDAIQLTTGLAATFVNNVSVAGNLTLTGNPSGIIKASTAVASTSGTSIDFTGIPSTVKRITVMFNGVSTSGTSIKQIQLGTASSFENTSYVGGSAYGGSGAGSTGSVATTGFQIASNVAAETLHGSFIFSLLDASTNLWAMQGSVVNNTGTFYFYNCAGTKALASVLTRIRITTVNGTDTFDAGSINILYE